MACSPCIVRNLLPLMTACTEKALHVGYCNYFYAGSVAETHDVKQLSLSLASNSPSQLLALCLGLHIVAASKSTCQDWKSEYTPSTDHPHCYKCTGGGSTHADARTAALTASLLSYLVMRTLRQEGTAVTEISSFPVSLTPINHRNAFSMPSSLS